MRRRLILSMSVMVFLVGCAEATPPVSSPAEMWRGRIGLLSSPTQPWEEMSHAAKQQWMGSDVMPFMRELFQDHDAARFENFSCATCHGADLGGGSFAMPSSSLMALHPTGTPEQHQMVRDHPEILRLMFSRVVPAMETLLGMPTYDEETGTGFSCFQCHPRAE